ncbi:DUF2391 family protein [Vibrio mediterranei]|uniref:DUF2391 family protein n=1 Tax=Vibrio mediterranei TaxID=689 RepID=UPI00406841F2
MKPDFNFEDVGQLLVGAFALGMPISFSEEAWQLGASLPTVNLLMIFLLSISFVTLYTYQSVFQRNVAKRRLAFVSRVFWAYVLTMLVVALILFCLDKLPVFEDPWIAWKRVLLIAMPASMGAIVVDSFDKE